MRAARWIIRAGRRSGLGNDLAAVSPELRLTFAVG